MTPPREPPVIAVAAAGRPAQPPEPGDPAATVGSALTRARASAMAAFVAQGFGFAVILTHLATFETRWDLDDLAGTGVMFGWPCWPAPGRRWPGCWRRVGEARPRCGSRC